jgi:hypothetical protein
MSDRQDCYIVCRCSQEHPIQKAVVEYFCTECKGNCFQYNKHGRPECLVDAKHRLMVSVRCKNRTPSNCGRTTACGQCVVVTDARLAKRAESCPLCLEDDPKVMVSFAPCGHLMCLVCFRTSMPHQRRYVKNQERQWVPACTACTATVPIAGACSHAALNLLLRPAYEVYKDRSFSMFLAEEEIGTVMCTICNSLNALPTKPCPAFNCSSCGAILCVACRAPQSSCQHATERHTIIAYFSAVFRRKLHVTCGRCSEAYPMARVGADALKFDCLACGVPIELTRSVEGTSGTSGGGAVATLSARLQPLAAEWDAPSWLVVFFVLRAYAVASRIFQHLGEAQRRQVLAAPCPIVGHILALLDVESLGGIDTHLRLSADGWTAFTATDGILPPATAGAAAAPAATAGEVKADEPPNRIDLQQLEQALSDIPPLGSEEAPTPVATHVRLREQVTSLFPEWLC